MKRRSGDFVEIHGDAARLPSDQEDALHVLTRDKGFDLSLPLGEEDAETFALHLADVLARKSYAIIQTYLSPKERQDAIDECDSVSGWTLPSRDFEAAYLGRSNCTKHATVNFPDRQKASPMRGDEGETPGASSLRRCDSLLTEVSMALEPLAPVRLGFQCWGRSSSIVRLPFESKGEEAALRPQSLVQKDYEDGNVLGHISFLETRKLMLMLMLDDAGGEVLLEPFDSSTGSPVVVPLTANQLLIFREDLLAYTFKPFGSAALLQCHLMMQPMAPDMNDLRTAVVPEQLMTATQVFLRSIASHYPCDIASGEDYWATVTGAADGLVRVPAVRWDASEYYSPEADKEGYTYAVHGGFCSDDTVVMFDNLFFGVSEVEAGVMSPAQRLVLQTGYEALHHAGISKAQARGYNCGVFLGDSGCDWPHLFGQNAGPQRCIGSSNCITGSRLAHALGLRGPTVAVDTACSSSLVAIGLAHTALRKAGPDQVDPGVSAHVRTALAQGCNLLLSPRMYIQYSGPHMLSPRGRCFTFDSSADGYARGEGCGSLVLKLNPPNSETQESLACLIGSAVNQDGRSASMTAPNGPSQQQCIRTSMLESKLSASEINVAECHGTGTALGDPIEVSALRMVMQERPAPILNTSAKTNLGHLEASAGMAGVIKVVNLLSSSCCPPNCHLRLLNPHMDTNGYPVYFADELQDYGSKTGISGVSSFGFGGTNARGDLWARCRRGFRTTWQLDTGEWVRQRHLYFDRIFHYGRPGPHTSDQVYISGSWDGFSALLEMQRESLGEYFANVRIGETGFEYFRIMVNQDPNQLIHPGEALAGQRAPVQGPNQTGKAASWLIGSKWDGLGAGATYRIRLHWSFTWEQGEIRRVTWEPTSVELPLPKALQTLADFRHSYAVVGSWTSWQFQAMVKSNEEEGLWTTSVHLGLSGEEEFQFARDNDWCQVIHPVASKVRSTAVAVVGPDNQGHGRNWLLRGRANELVTIQLRLLDAQITVCTSSESKGVLTWQSDPCEDSPCVGAPLFLISGTWNGWALSTMEQAKCLASPSSEEASESELAVSAVTCNNGHPLQLTACVRGGSRCSRCASIIDAWHDYRCGPCDFELCVRCYASAHEAVRDTDTEKEKSIFQYNIVLGDEGCEEFQIVMDDWRSHHQLTDNSHWRFPVLDPSMKEAQRRLYPHVPRASLGEALVCGPDNRGHGLNWMILGDPGQEFLVTVDPSQEDGHKVVWWRAVAGRD